MKQTIHHLAENMIEAEGSKDVETNFQGRDPDHLEIIRNQISQN